MLIIGSTALKYHYPDFPREPKDFDVIVNKNDEFPYVREGLKIEKLENPIIDKLYKGLNEKYIYPGDLTTLKASHLCWNINWEKHQYDLQFLLKKGNKIDEQLFWELYDYWNEYHGKNKRSDLKMSKEDFFDNAINYSENHHDDLHKIINPIPMYTRVLKDGCEVELDENKFYNLTHEEKLEFVREEVYIMAFERWKHLDYRTAYSHMLKKFIMSHVPKFALIFTLENYIELHKPKFNFIKQLENGIQNS